MRYSVPISDGDPLVVDSAALILEVVRDTVQGVPSAIVAARFHNSVAELIAHTTESLARRTGLTTVGLTGGCFQNTLLTERTVARLHEQGLRVLLHGEIAPNDGGIAIGQAVSARARVRRNTS